MPQIKTSSIAKPRAMCKLSQLVRLNPQDRKLSSFEVTRNSVRKFPRVLASRGMPCHAAMKFRGRNTTATTGVFLGKSWLSEVKAALKDIFWDRLRYFISKKTLSQGISIRYHLQIMRRVWTFWQPLIPLVLQSSLWITKEWSSHIILRYIFSFLYK